MAYTLQAIVADAAALAHGTIEKKHIVARPQQKAMLPLTESLREKYNIPFLPFDDSEIKDPVKVVEALVRSLVLTGRVTYIEAMSFGGAGYQASVVLESGHSVGAGVVSQDAGNIALKAIGEQKFENFDEFDALGLGEHRDTDDWIQNN